MRVGIEINGVLRNTLGKIEQTYQKFMIDKTEGIEYEDDFKYQITYPIENLEIKKHFSFRDDDEMYSFLYEEFPMEIFGHAQSTEYSTFNDFNEIYLNLRDNHDILIVSDEIGKSKPASLFFLSKFGCLVEKVKFGREREARAKIFRKIAFLNAWKIHLGCSKLSASTLIPGHGSPDRGVSQKPVISCAYLPPQNLILFSA